MLTEGRTDGRTENRTPISHPATSRCDKNKIQMSSATNFAWHFKGYALDIFQKAVLCLALYIEEVKLQTSVMINLKPFFVTIYAQHFLF